MDNYKKCERHFKEEFTKNPQSCAKSVQFDNVPPELRVFKAFLFWRLDWIKWRNENSKVPYYASREYIDHKHRSVWVSKKASSTNPDTWMTWDDMFAGYFAHNEFSGGKDFLGRKSKPWSGIGFALCKEFRITAIDVDECVNPETNEITPFALAVINHFRSYWEISPSGSGIRIFIFANIPDVFPGTQAVCGNKFEVEINGHKGNIEVYDHARYVTITGHCGPIGHVVEGQDSLIAIYTLHFEQHPESLCRVKRDDSNESYPQSPTIPCGYSAQQIIDRINQSRCHADKFRSLMAGDISAYDNDDSDADFALACLLAKPYYCGADPAMIREIMEQSQLTRRWKWHKGNYADRTISKAIDRVSYEAFEDCFTSEFGDLSGLRITYTGSHAHTHNDDGSVSVCVPVAIGVPIDQVDQLNQAPNDSSTISLAGFSPDELDAMSGTVQDLREEETETQANAEATLAFATSTLSKHLHPCRNPYILHQTTREFDTDIFPEYRCKSWGCFGCCRIRKDMHCGNVRCRLSLWETKQRIDLPANVEPNLHFATISRQGWNTLRRYLNRHHASYFSVDTDLATQLVVATTPFEHSQPISTVEAITILCEAIDRIPVQKGKPVTASHDWKLPTYQPKNKLITHGKFPAGTTKSDVHQALDQLQLEAEILSKSAHDVWHQGGLLCEIPYDQRTLQHAEERFKKLLILLPFESDRFWNKESGLVKPATDSNAKNYDDLSDFGPDLKLSKTNFRKQFEETRDLFPT